MNANLMRLYREKRAKHPEDRAQTLLRWVRSDIEASMHAYISRAPDPGESSEVHIPGVGLLRYLVHYDNEHDPWDDCGAAFQWLAPEHFNYRESMPLGTRLWENCYSLDVWDHTSLKVVRFCNDGKFEQRRAYWHGQGYSRQDADLRARQSIYKECEHWRKIAQGDVNFVGLEVELRVPTRGGKLPTVWSVVKNECCWGFDVEDWQYVLDTMNDWANTMVRARWEEVYKIPAPPTFVSGHDPRVDAAWRAWQTAMVVSDRDGTIADPIFVSTYRGKRGRRTIRA